MLTLGHAHGAPASQQARPLSCETAIHHLLPPDTDMSSQVEIHKLMFSPCAIQLCATSTVGAAATGYAFGRLSTGHPRPRSNKRKAGDITSHSFYQPFGPSTPSESSQTASAPTTQGPKPDFLGRPQSASFARNSSRLSEPGIGIDHISEEHDWRVSAFDRREGTATDQAPSDLVGSGTGTAKSSWLRRMSTFSSFHVESPTSSSRPNTPSISFSNGSSAPIIPTTASPSTSRNKLVKRASSQRVLHTSAGNQPSYSRSQMLTLRRPATSHQRSATIQEQLFQSNPDLSRDIPRPSFQCDDGLLPNKDDENSLPTQQWQPFFRRSDVQFVGDTPSKPGASMRNPNRSRYVKSIVPVSGDTPILLKADLILEPGLHEPIQIPSISAYSTTPCTPTTVDKFPIPSSNVSNTGSGTEQETKPRSSFSMSDLFSTPSPSTWKVGRNSSLRRKKGPSSVPMGRRVASAPLPLDESHTISHTHNAASESRIAGKSTMRSPSSPLPPLNRFSVFEVDLAGSDPPSPQPQNRSSPSPTSNSPVSFPNPVFQPVARSKSHRPSGAPSDRASTLVGSDNENSRVFPGDGDELDCRSDTIYDSIRTGATGSSHSGVRGPRIETVFDNSPPQDLLKQNLTILQEKLSNPHLLRDFITEEEESVRTPVGAAHSHEEDISTPSRDPTHISSSSDLSSSPPSIPAASSESGANGQKVGNGFDEAEWTFDDTEPISWGHDDPGGTALTYASPTNIDHTAGFDTPLEEADIFKDPPRSNIFEWSERSHVGKDDEEGTFPRPSTVHGNKQGIERGSRSAGRRGASGLHFRSQSVPLPPDSSNHRILNNTSKLDAWILGGKGVSEDWDGDFEFDEPVKSIESTTNSNLKHRATESSGMLVPRAILERQASVHGQFGQVKELTLLVEQLKRLRQQGQEYCLLDGQSSELWKEAEGIVNLATLDDDEEPFFPPRSPNSPGFDNDPFDDDSPTTQQRENSPRVGSREIPQAKEGHSISRQLVSQSSPMIPSKLATPPRSRPRQDSTANVKTVLEHIQQQRNSFDLMLDEPKSAQKKLPFDTTSLRDLVTRAGVVTRALKEIVRKAESPGNVVHTHEKSAGDPPDPPFSQIFHQSPSSSPPHSRTITAF